jgi:hypothetical protein
MSRRPATVDVEEIQTTKSEKLLAVVLAVFLLIGGAWAYDRLGDAARGAVSADVRPEDRAAVDRANAAVMRQSNATANEQRALARLAFAREAYRTALDADAPAEALRRTYEARQREHERAQAASRAARADARAAQPAAEKARARIADAEEGARDHEALLAFGLRLVFVVGALGLGLWLLARLRRRGSRWFPLAAAAVGSATALAVFLAGDYLTDYVDPLDLGPLVLSLVGIVLTLVGFAALQRYLARRIPARRVRKGECPFCGYPVGEGAHCEGCGREVVAACSSCASPRRVGTLHCRACGAA